LSITSTQGFAGTCYGFESAAKNGEGGSMNRFLALSPLAARYGDALLALGVFKNDELV
jgi:hypothetical protein